MLENYGQRGRMAIRRGILIIPLARPVVSCLPFSCILASAVSRCCEYIVG